MDMKKTVWCISKYASPPKYGVGARLFYVAREFSRMGVNTLLISSDSNHLAKYPSSDKSYNSEMYENLEHVWIKTKKYSKSASLNRFMSWFDFELKLFKLPRSKYLKPDVVIISSLSIFTIIYGAFLKLKYKCKLVFEIRDIYPLTLTEEFGVNKLHPMIIILGFLEKFGYRYSDLIVGTMPNLKQHVAERIGRAKDVFYSPLGIHERWSNSLPFKNDSIDELFPDNDKFVVGYAGSMGTSNALHSFIQSIKKLSDNREIYFVLVGAGDLKNEFEEELSSFENVVIGPKISQDDIPYFLSKCDVLYFSAHDSKIWEYGQSLNKLIDYMMAGKPVIASYSGYQSMLNEANSGLFIPTKSEEAIIDAIHYFSKMSSQERIDMGAKGKDWIEQNHDYKVISENYYNKICTLIES